MKFFRYSRHEMYGLLIALSAFVLLCGLTLFLSGCGWYGDVTNGISRSIDPQAHQAYDRSVECQKQGRSVCGKP